MDVCIEKGPLRNPKLREAFVDKFKLFTAIALAATAMLSRYLRLNPHDMATNVLRLMEAAKNWEADLAGGIILDYPHPASAAATLMAASLPYANISWGVDEATGPAASFPPRLPDDPIDMLGSGSPTEPKMVDAGKVAAIEGGETSATA
eukprot:jgi/Tetstr1/424004/TSEL_014615.t1